MANNPGVGEGRGVAQRPLRVGLLLAESFTLSAFSLFVDHLRLAADEGDRSRPILVQWSIMAAHGAPTRASCGVSVAPTSALLDPRGLDYVVVVGGVLHAGAQVTPEATAYLRRAAGAGTTLVGLCTGGFILCRAGLMQGRRCCVSWFHHQDFLDEFPDGQPVADRLFVVDGDRITCAGGAGTADLASYLVERHLGRAAAQKANQILLFDRARYGHEAQPHPPLTDGVADPRVRRALLLMEQNLADPLPISVLAAKLGLSTRQFERIVHAAIGQRPATLYRTMRLHYARWLLRNTVRSVTNIALDAGFSDGAHFSRQFKAEFGATPSESRTRPPASDAELAGPRVFEG